MSGSLDNDATSVGLPRSFAHAAAASGSSEISALANFRLHLEYRLPTADARLAVQVHPSSTVALPIGKAGAWRVLELQFEQLGGKAVSLVAEVDGKTIVDVPELAKSRNPQLKAEVTFPDGIAGVPTQLALVAQGGAEIRQA